MRHINRGTGVQFVLACPKLLFPIRVTACSTSESYLCNHQHAAPRTHAHFLKVIETTDVVFAIDSIPAVLSITSDSFIAYTSNIFAILGLRALYFCLAAAMHMFHYLPLALSFILIFIGAKMLLAFLFGVHISVEVCVACVCVYVCVCTAVDGHCVLLGCTVSPTVIRRTV